MYVSNSSTLAANWMLYSKLIPSVGQQDAEFGISVDVHKFNLAVGTWTFGNVFVYSYFKNDWSQTAVLTPSSTGAYTYFGSALSIHENKILVGAFFDSPAGAAYIFERVSEQPYWIQSAKLQALEAISFSYFGGSVGIFLDTAVVGAFAASNVYIFHRANVNNWSLVQILSSSDSGRFGFSSNIYDGYIIVGAPSSDTVNKNAGAAYLYHREGVRWSQNAAFFPHNSLEEGNFGYAVDIGVQVDAFEKEHLTTVVSAFAAGYAEFFTMKLANTWDLEDILTPTSHSTFGKCVAIGTAAVLVGDHTHKVQGVSLGAIIVFNTSLSAWPDPTSYPSLVPSLTPTPFSSYNPSLAPSIAPEVTLHPSSREPSAAPSFVEPSSYSRSSFIHADTSPFLVVVVVGSLFFLFVYILAQKMISADSSWEHESVDIISPNCTVDNANVADIEMSVNFTTIEDDCVEALV